MACIVPQGYQIVNTPTNHNHQVKRHFKSYRNLWWCLLLPSLMLIFNLPTNTIATSWWQSAGKTSQQLGIIIKPQKKKALETGKGAWESFHSLITSHLTIAQNCTFISAITFETCVANVKSVRSVCFWWETCDERGSENCRNALMCAYWVNDLHEVCEITSNKSVRRNSNTTYLDKNTCQAHSCRVRRHGLVG